MRYAIVAVVLVLAAGRLNAQAPQFEVASVKAVEMEVPFPRASLTVTGGRLTARAYSLDGLMRFALDSPLPLVEPDWLRRSGVRVEIQAVMPAGATRADARQMLQALLVERMGLKFHVEPRTMAAYELVTAPGGPKLHEVPDEDELNAVFTPGPGVKAMDLGISGEKRMILIGTAQRTVSARSNYDMIAEGEPLGSKFRLDAKRITMQELAVEIWGKVGRPVIDRTGLAGVYQLSMELPQRATSLQMLQSLSAAGITTNRNGDPLDSGFAAAASVDVFKEVEKLGLKLQERTAPIDFIVIDNINKTATEN
jgi:uncharacterized protein (TIGR03435 family)